MITKRPSIEKLLYLTLVVLFLINIFGAALGFYTAHKLQESINIAKIARDEQIMTLQHNQNTILCINKGFVTVSNYIKHPDGSVTVKPFIDQCIKDNK